MTPPHPPPGPAPSAGTAPVPARGVRRAALLALGWTATGLGVVGAFLPGLPTTIFLLIALWAFARSSPRLHAKLYNHPRLGPPLRAWHADGVIPPRAKLLAVGLMAASLVVLWETGAAAWLVGTVGAILAAVALFIVTRPSRPTTGEKGSAPRA